MTRPFKVLGIQQIAIGGPDKARLQKLWVDMFGLEVTGTFKSERENVDEDICAIGTGPFKVEVDLMQPIDPDKKPAVHTTPLNHIGLWIDDLPTAVTWLSAQGVRFAPGGIRKGAAGFDICFLHPKANDEFPIAGEGVLIELVQAPSEVVSAFARLAQAVRLKAQSQAQVAAELSGGNQQKVLIGRAFALNPDILILNDPARGIDVGAKAELYKHLRDFAATGKAVIYLSSEIEEFVGFCSRVMVFRNGSIFDEFKGSEIHPTAILESMFGQIRPNQIHPSEDGEAHEDQAMKIVEFDAHSEPQDPRHASSWKTRTSPYPSFDKKKNSAGDGSEAMSGNALEALSSQSRALRADEVTPLATTTSAPRMGPIKIREFNAGPTSILAKPSAHGELGNSIKALDSLALMPESDGDRTVAKTAIKIVEYGNDQPSLNPVAGSVNRTGIKIVEYGDHKAKGK